MAAWSVVGSSTRSCSSGLGTLRGAGGPRRPRAGGVREDDVDPALL
jgi:hypothetical protein